MAKTTAAAVLLLLGSIAQAGPTARFGLTGAIDDTGAPGKYEIGPMAAIGERAGAFVGEVEWAYLSFFEPDATPGGVQRLGVTLRADLLRSEKQNCRYLGLGCTRGRSFYGEIGAAERFGQWLINPSQTPDPPTSPNPEVHIGFGLEFDNQVFPNRNGWQLGLRLSMTSHAGETGTACSSTGTCTPNPGTASGTDTSVLIEWMFVIGK